MDYNVFSKKYKLQPNAKEFKESIDTELTNYNEKTEKLKAEVKTEKLKAEVKNEMIFKPIE